MRLQLTRKSDYALRTMIHLAMRPAGYRTTVEAIAEEEGIPRKFLEKIIRDLGGAGLVRTSAGKNGGLELARPAEDVCFSDILRITEGSMRMAACTGDDASCALLATCLMTDVWRRLQQAADDILASTTLADVVAPRLIPLVDARVEPPVALIAPAPAARRRSPSRRPAATAASTPASTGRPVPTPPQ